MRYLAEFNSVVFILFALFFLLPILAKQHKKKQQEHNRGEGFYKNQAKI